MVEKVELYDLNFIEVDGDFRQEKQNRQVLPAMITNYALWYGKENGFLETSLMEELHKITGVYSGLQQPEKDASVKEVEKYGADFMTEFSTITDESKMNKVIYLGLVGANPDLDLGYGDFLKKFHGDLTEQMEIYINLVVDFSAKENEFKKEFENKTSISRGKDEKK